MWSHIYLDVSMSILPHVVVLINTILLKFRELVYILNEKHRKLLNEVLLDNNLLHGRLCFIGFESFVNLDIGIEKLLEYHILTAVCQLTCELEDILWLVL